LTLRGRAYGGTAAEYDRLRQEIPAGLPVHCGFVGSAARETLESLKVESMFYRHMDDASQTSREIHRFPALKNLCLEHCMMHYSYRLRLLPGAEMDYQQDPLHDLLRGADHLQTLEVSPYFHPLSTVSRIQDSVYVPRPRLFKKVEMPHLLLAELPPPAMWAIDILAPQLEALMFKPMYGNFEHQGTPWIPKFEDAPVPFERLGKLRVMRFACSQHDDIIRLRAWLLQLDSVTSLALHNYESYYEGTGRGYLETGQHNSNETRKVLHQRQDACGFRQEAQSSRRLR
jgi:hypothetical protein